MLAVTVRKKNSLSIPLQSVGGAVDELLELVYNVHYDSFGGFVDMVWV
jgi:hypothetical protein